MILRKENPQGSALPFTTEAQHKQLEEEEEGTERICSSSLTTTISRKPSLSKTLLNKPIVSRLLPSYLLPVSLPPVPSSLRRNFSFNTQNSAATTTATTATTSTKEAEGADSGWEGDSEAEDGDGDDEDDGEKCNEKRTIINPPPPGLAAINQDGGGGGNLTTVGGRNIQSCLRHSSSGKSKKSNKVKFSLDPTGPAHSTTASSGTNSRSSSSARESGGASEEEQEEEGHDDNNDNDNDNGGGGGGRQKLTKKQNREKKKKKEEEGTTGSKRRSKRNLFITTISRPLRSPLLLVSPTQQAGTAGHHNHHQAARPVRIFLEALPLPDKDPSVRASYPHPLLLDLNDLVPPSAASSPPDPSTPASSSSSSSSSSTTTTTTTTTAIEILDLAARQTLFYADEVLYAPLQHPNHTHTHSYYSSTIATTTNLSLPPVPWNDARLQDLARFWLRPEDGWEVVFRCEVLPWLGWFRLQGDGNIHNDNPISEEWWDKSVRGETQGDDNKKKKKKGKGGQEQEQKGKNDGDNDDDVNDDNGDDWVCFSRKHGVMRIDLTVKFVYRPRSHCSSE